MPTPQEALDTARERWNAGDLDGYLELYDDAIVLHGSGPEPMDKAGARALYATLHAAFDTPSLTFDEILWSGEDTATVRFTMRGRHVGEFMGVPPANEAVVLPGITVMRFRDGRVVERHTASDMLGLLVQIGAVPAPAPA